MEDKQVLEIIKQVVDKSIQGGIWSKSEDVFLIHQAFLKVKEKFEAPKESLVEN